MTSRLAAALVDRESRHDVGSPPRPHRPTDGPVDQEPASATWRDHRPTHRERRGPSEPSEARRMHRREAQLPKCGETRVGLQRGEQQHLTIIKTIERGCNRLFSRAARDRHPQEGIAAVLAPSAQQAEPAPAALMRAGATDSLLTLSTRPSTQTVVARTSERSASNTFQAGAAEERPVGGLVTQH